MSKLYHALIPGHIYCGGANDIQQMVDEDGIDVVVDLRAESTGCAAHQPEVQWVHIPLSDHAEEPEDIRRQLVLPTGANYSGRIL